MYGRLWNVYDHVHGMHDEVHEHGTHEHGNDEHAARLLRHVPNVHGLHDARLLHVRSHVQHVCRYLHKLRDDVRKDGRQGRDDEAVR